MATAKKLCFPVFWNSYLHVPVFKVSIFSNDYKILNWCKWIYEDIPSQILLTILLFFDCSKMARMGINTSFCTKEKSYKMNSFFVFFSKLIRQKSRKGEQNTCINVSKLCAEGFLTSLPWCEKVNNNTFFLQN